MCTMRFLSGSSTLPMRGWQSSKTSKRHHGKICDQWRERRRGLRTLILRSARAYPARRGARSMGRRARATGKMFAQIVNFSPVLAQVCPEKLAQLVVAEVIDPLPKRSWRRSAGPTTGLRPPGRHPRQAGSGTHRRRGRSLLGMFMPIGINTYDFKDTGIDRSHGFFYPPSPAHEPFAAFSSMRRTSRATSSDSVQPGNQGMAANPRNQRAPIRNAPAARHRLPMGSPALLGYPANILLVLRRNGPPAARRGISRDDALGP